MLTGFRSRRPVPSRLSTCSTSCVWACKTKRPHMLYVNARAGQSSLPSSLELTPVGCCEHTTCFCTMTPSPLTCQPKTSKGFKQSPFLDTPTPSMTLTNSSCNFNVSVIELGTRRQHPTCTGYSRMRTEHLLPASSPHGSAMSWRFWSCPSCQTCSFQATHSTEAVHPPLTPLMCP